MWPAIQVDIWRLHWRAYIAGSGGSRGLPWQCCRHIIYPQISSTSGWGKWLGKATSNWRDIPWVGGGVRDLYLRSILSGLICMGSMLREKRSSLKKSILHSGCVCEWTAAGRVEGGWKYDLQRGGYGPGDRYFVNILLRVGLVGRILAPILITVGAPVDSLYCSLGRRL